jgi:acyl-coenzyme A synthetase/AMP-(fatty) acid ligase
MRDENAATALLSGLELYKKRLAIEDRSYNDREPMRWTYGDLRELSTVYSRTLAGLLTTNKSGQLGPRIGFLIDPSVEFAGILFACWRLGAVAFPLGACRLKIK